MKAEQINFSRLKCHRLKRLMKRSLLSHFGAQLGTTSLPKAWMVACRAHQKRGAVLPPAQRPAVLGRAIALNKYAVLLSEASEGGFDERSASELIRQYAGQSKIDRIDDELSLRAAKVGQHLVWATFDEENPSHTPFPKSDYRATEIATALGLGGLRGTTLVLLTYSTRSDSAEIQLYRPTVADADWYPYYRPYDVPDHPWGYTHPLPPNLLGLRPQPEVVHSDELRGDRLIFPFKIATPEV